LTPFLCVASFTYFTLMIGLYGLGFWLPRILQSLGPTAVSIGWNSAIPYGIGGLVGVAWAYHSDSVQERRWHLLIAFATAALGQSIAAVFHTTGLSVCGFTLSAFGIFSGMPIFWSVVTNKLSGEMTAVGTALVNSLGNLGGFVGPSWIGWITAKTGNVRAGLIALAGLLLIAGFISIFVSGRTQPTPRRKLTGC
jgi:nitrate/nitrite transporter NarK